MMKLMCVWLNCCCHCCVGVARCVSDKVALGVVELRLLLCCVGVARSAGDSRDKGEINGKVAV